jgi:hypothetical protein
MAHAQEVRTLGHVQRIGEFLFTVLEGDGGRKGEKGRALGEHGEGEEREKGEHIPLVALRRMSILIQWFPEGTKSKNIGIKKDSMF